MILSYSDFRRISRWLHRWIGLTVGLVLVLYGLSGSYIVFRERFEGWMDPSLKYSMALEPRVTLAQVAAMRSTDQDPLRILIPGDAGRNVEFLYGRKPAERFTDYFDPARGERVGTRGWYDSVTGLVYSFHHDMFLGGIGKTVAATHGSLSFLMLAAGMVLWWPRRGQVRQAYTTTALRRAKGRLRVHLELHRLLGAYVFVMLFMVVAGGVFTARPDWFVTRSEAPKAAAAPLDYARLDRALAEAGLSARGSLLRIRPGTISLMRPDGSFYVLEQGAGQFVPRVPATAGDRVHAFVRDIHAGRYWGGWGELVVFVTGLLPLVFYVTGLVVWKKKRDFRKAAAATAQAHGRMAPPLARPRGGAMPA